MSATAETPGLVIGGELVAAAATFDVINPATGAVFAAAPDCSREQLDAAFAAAQGAEAAWAADGDARRAALGAAAKELGGAAQELAPMFVAEQGKPMARAVEEVMLSAAWLGYYAQLELSPEVVQDDDDIRVEVIRRPAGVVAAITPWNFPLVLACWKIGPALAAGCTMVLKPSPFTPLATLKMVAILNRVLPPGVLNAVSGGNDLGAWMTAHPTPRKISFTGSVATGKRVMAAAAEDLKRVTLELGGNDPAIILDDADPAAVAAGVAGAGFINSGQTCIAIKRVYAPESMYDDVVEALAEQARGMLFGDGMAEGTTHGPINNAPQFERLRELYDDALANGAESVTGGGPRDGDGYFFDPAVLRGARDGMRIVDEEQFGPILPVVPYSNLDEALANANDTHFGLGGSVWSSDPERASGVAAQLACGTAWINTHAAPLPNAPFGGLKWSGIGVENGPWGLHGFTEIQVLHQAK